MELVGCAVGHFVGHVVGLSRTFWDGGDPAQLQKHLELVEGFNSLKGHLGLVTLGVSGRTWYVPWDAWDASMDFRLLWILYKNQIPRLSSLLSAFSYTPIGRVFPIA